MPRVATHRRTCTLALRIQFNGPDGVKVSSTAQSHVQSLVPWLRITLTSLRLPQPKSTNIVKPSDATSIDMYWDVETDSVRAHVLYPPFSSDRNEHLPEICEGYD